MVRDFKADYWIVGVTVTTIFETAWALRGLEQILLDMVMDPELTNYLLDIPYHYHLAAAKKLVHLGVDMIWTGDDVGAQNRMLISPKMWRQYFKPRMANFIAELKAINPDLKVIFASGYGVEDLDVDMQDLRCDGFIKKPFTVMKLDEMLRRII